MRVSLVGAKVGACGNTQQQGLPRLLLLLLLAAVAVLLVVVVVVPSGPQAVHGRMLQYRQRQQQQQRFLHALLLLARVQGSRHSVRGGGRAWAPTGASVDSVVLLCCCRTLQLCSGLLGEPRGSMWRQQLVRPRLLLLLFRADRTGSRHPRLPLLQHCSCCRPL